MNVVHFANQLERPYGTRGIVPTMGALHAGHASLIAASKKRCAETVVSIFVNPTQFGPKEDFSRYPRTLEEDLRLCELSGVETVYVPSVDEMYPDGLDAMNIHIARIGDLWEGAKRPGHFDGVSTVVAKLFAGTKPTHAFFGQKDLQQCAVIAGLVRSLKLPILLKIEPTIREADGLALSSRNRYLSEAARKIAPRIYETLQIVKGSFAPDRKPQNEILLEGATRLEQDFDVDYLAIVDHETMYPCNFTDGNAALIVACKIEGTRLIDNLLINS